MEATPRAIQGKEMAVSTSQSGYRGTGENLARIPQTRRANRISVTHHAKKRAKQRLKWNSAAIVRMAKIAYIKGKGIDTTKGKLKKFLLNKFANDPLRPCTVIIYAETIFLFNNKTLITVIPVPTDLKKYIRIR